MIFHRHYGYANSKHIYASHFKRVLNRDLCFARARSTQDNTLKKYYGFILKCTVNYKIVVQVFAIS